jgi:hypothetical protein
MSARKEWSLDPRGHCDRFTEPGPPCTGAWRGPERGAVMDCPATLSLVPGEGFEPPTSAV